jgi:excisionase family DNA binding protein
MLLSPAQAAERLSVDKAWVLRRLHDGTLPYIQLSPRIFRIEADDVDRLITNGRRKARRGQKPHAIA